MASGAWRRGQRTVGSQEGHSLLAYVSPFPLGPPDVAPADLESCPMGPKTPLTKAGIRGPGPGKLKEKKAGFC